MASESDSSDGEWEENGLEDVICICLFCNREDNNTELSLKHISEQHNFDLLPFTEKLGRGSLSARAKPVGFSHIN